MSATLDGARVAALARRRAGDREPGPQLSRSRPAISAAMRARASRTRSPMRSARALRAETGSLLVFLPGAGEIRRAETLLKERVRDPAVDIVALYGALDAREQDRAIAPRAGGPPQGGAGDLDRGDLAHHRGRARRHRQRARARAALRARRRPDAAGDRARVARRRRPAPRPRRPHRAGRLLPAVGRAADRLARALYAAGNSRPPICRPSCSIWRNGARAIRARSPSSIRRRAAALAEARALLGELGALDARGPHHRRRPQAARAAAAAAAGAHGGRCRGRRRRRCWPPRSPPC